MPDVRRSLRRWWLPWAALAAVAVLAGVLIGMLAGSLSQAGDESGESQARLPSAEEVPEERLEELQVALSSPDVAVQAAALDPLVRETLQESGRPLLPAGSSVTIDEGSSAITGETATVLASVRGPQAGKFTLLLALEDGVWRVFSAVPA